MTTSPFENRGQAKRGLLARLTGRPTNAAAAQDVERLLAETGWGNITAADVSAILKRHKLTTATANAELLWLFTRAVAHAAADGALTSEEQLALAGLQSAFDISRSDADSALQEAARAIYRQTFISAIEDGIITDDERARLLRIPGSLGLPPDVAERLYKEEATHAVRLYFNNAVADRRFSAKEEERLNQIGSGLGIDIAFGANTDGLLDKFRTLAKIEDGQIPEVQAPVLLQRGEVCYFVADGVTHKELRTVTKRINYAGPTASIKIMKGVRYRIGSIAPQRVSEDVLVAVDKVTFILTSKRVLLQGLRKNTTVALPKVIHFTLFTDGLQIEKGTGKDIVLVGDADWELAAACLDAASRKAR
jgi:tellurite resistance protein